MAYSTVQHQSNKVEVEKFEEAIKQKNENILHTLINNNRSLLNLVNIRGFSMLLIAVENSACDIIALLLNEGADINVRNATGDTLLHAAARGATKEVIEFLIDRGLSVNAQEKTHETPLHKACMRTVNSVEIAEVFINHGADVNSTGFYRTPLHIAVILENIPLVRLLLEQSSTDVDKLSTDLDDCNTALHHACRLNNIDIVEMLLQAGANKNICNKFNQLPTELTTNEDIKLLLQRYLFASSRAEKLELINTRKQLECLNAELNQAKYEIEYLTSQRLENSRERLQSLLFSNCRR